MERMKKIMDAILMGVNVLVGVFVGLTVVSERSTTFGDVVEFIVIFAGVYYTLCIFLGLLEQSFKKKESEEQKD